MAFNTLSQISDTVTVKIIKIELPQNEHFMTPDPTARTQITATIAGMTTSELKWEITPQLPNGAKLHSAQNGGAGGNTLNGVNGVWVSSGSVINQTYTLRAGYINSPDYIYAETQVTVVYVDIEEDAYAFAFTNPSRQQINLKFPQPPIPITWTIEPVVEYGARLYTTQHGGTAGTTVDNTHSIWLYPGAVKTNYTLTATFPDTTHIYDTAEIFVYMVDELEVSSPVAYNSPQKFFGLETDFGNPCSLKKPGQALVIYYDQVVNSDFTLKPFDIDLKAIVQPETLPNTLFTPSWTRVSGPNSGVLNQTNQRNVIFQNPTEGGLYKFEFDLQGSVLPTSGANVHLPLAGPDITEWLLGEVIFMRTYGSTVRATTMAAETWVPFKTWFTVQQRWIEISAGLFDYEIKPQNQDGTAPCGKLQDHGALCWPVTVNGVVVHGSNINNMLWAVFGSSWGWNTLMLETGAHLNQAARYAQGDSSIFFDTSGSINAIRTGSTLYELPYPPSLTDLKLLMSPAVVKRMQDNDIYEEDKLWPCNTPYAPNLSTLERPDFLD